MKTISRHECFWGPLPRKIHLAHLLNSQLGPDLLAMPRIRQQLTLLTDRAGMVNQWMQSIGIPTLCSVCAATGVNGGCCSLEMADESDTVLLLVNLLAGNEVQMQRTDGLECVFLGASGCSLRFKPMFCLNYLCRQIRQRLTPGKLGQLERVSGLLLQTQYQIEQLLLAILQTSGRLA
jgi:hypothetical protein